MHYPTTLPLQPFALQDARGTAVMLFFLSLTCPVCKKLIPVLKPIRASEGNWLRVLLASDGEQPEPGKRVNPE